MQSTHQLKFATNMVQLSMDSYKNRKIIESSLREGHSNASTIRFLKTVLEDDAPSSCKNYVPMLCE